MTNDTPAQAAEPTKDPESSEKSSPVGGDLKDRVIEVLKSCFDPEIPVNIYELGLIYELAINDGNDVDIKMTLTSPMCPVAGSLPPEVETKVKALEGVQNVKVQVVWEPPWKPEMMTEAARLKLGMM